MFFPGRPKLGRDLKFKGELGPLRTPCILTEWNIYCNDTFSWYPPFVGGLAQVIPDSIYLK